MKNPLLLVVILIALQIPVDWLSLFTLAFQSIGVVYGDLGTSPLYTLPEIFQSGIKHRDDLLGAYSLVFYALTIITVIKYAFIVLSANDNGEGMYNKKKYI